MSSALYLVVTDLDGSLLDHYTYAYDAARPALELLEQLRIPVVLASSKTQAEMLALRRELGNEHPLIVENGAAVLIPEAYFTTAPRDCVFRDGFWVREFAPSRESWQPLLRDLHSQFPGLLMDFASAGIDEIARMTGLSAEQAALANDRAYSEPIQWRGDDSEFSTFLAAVEHGGARALQGGRFVSLAGDCDKGIAWRWLREAFALAGGGAAVYDLALGDGGNDVPMLESAHRAVVIPAPDRAPPQVRRSDGLLSVTGQGPEAWAEGVKAWLRELYS